MSIKTIQKLVTATLIRDSLFYGYHMAKVEEGKTCMSENIDSFILCFWKDDLDKEPIQRNYYEMLTKIKQVK
jgi:hypothetical protein